MTITLLRVTTLAPPLLNKIFANVVPNDLVKVLEQSNGRCLFRQLMVNRFRRRLGVTNNTLRELANSQISVINMTQLVTLGVRTNLVIHYTVRRHRRNVHRLKINIKNLDLCGDETTRRVVNNIGNVTIVPQNNVKVQQVLPHTMRTRLTSAHLNTNTNKGARTCVLSNGQHFRFIDNTLVRDDHVVMCRRATTFIGRLDRKITSVCFVMRRVLVIVNTSVTTTVDTVVTIINV